MRSIKLDKMTKDFIFENGSIKTINGNENILQNIRIRLSVWLGEWFLNTNFGVDWINILGKTNNIQEIEETTKKIIKLNPNVTEIDVKVANIDKKNRKYIIKIIGKLKNNEVFAEIIEV